jgi:hypothetical protein
MSTLPALLPPCHHNHNLEKLIADRKNHSKLDLRSKRLTNQDAEIIAYYALASNKVSSMIFASCYQMNSNPVNRYKI